MTDPELAQASQPHLGEGAERAQYGNEKLYICVKGAKKRKGPMEVKGYMGQRGQQN